MAHRQHDLTEVELRLEQVPARDLETDEETTFWQVDHDTLDRPCKGHTPAEALKVFADCVDKDDSDDVAINLEQLLE